MRIIILIITLTGLGLPPVFAFQLPGLTPDQTFGPTFTPASNPPASNGFLTLAENKKPLRKPTNGMTMRKVKRLFGEPIKEMPSTGKPPITRWVYEQFTVYFEGTHVIHAVKNRQILPDNPVKG